VLTALLGLVGVLPRPRAKPLGAGELAQVHHAGLFADQRRSASALRGMLGGLLGSPVRLEQFVGQWVALDPGARSRLGDGPGAGLPARLGEESVLGARVWCVDARIRVVAGPLDRARFRELWPGGERVRFLWELLRTYLGPLIECDLVWELAPDAPAAARLGGDQRLGRDAWLGWSEFGRPDTRVPSPPWHNPRPDALRPESHSEGDDSGGSRLPSEAAASAHDRSVPTPLER
jgi:type VI secretion system protein ImpH